MKETNGDVCLLPPKEFGGEILEVVVSCFAPSSYLVFFEELLLPFGPTNIGISWFSIGNTSSIQVHFPASHVSLPRVQVKATDEPNQHSCLSEEKSFAYPFTLSLSLSTWQVTLPHLESKWRNSPFVLVYVWTLTVRHQTWKLTPADRRADPWTTFLCRPLQPPILTEEPIKFINKGDIMWHPYSRQPNYTLGPLISPPPTLHWKNMKWFTLKFLPLKIGGSAHFLKPWGVTQRNAPWNTSLSKKYVMVPTLYFSSPYLLMEENPASVDI